MRGDRAIQRPLGLGPLCWVAAGLWAGCGAEVTAFEAPEGVAYVGALLVSSSGTRGTVLQRVAPRVELQLDDDDSAFVYGFDQATLELVLGRPVTEPSLEGELRSSVGCETRLPKPAWLETFVAEDGPSLRAEDAPRITAAWVGARCASSGIGGDSEGLVGPVPWPAVDAVCSGVACPTSISDCRIQAQLDSCVPGLRAADGSLGADGEVCFELAESCAERAAPEGAQQRFECPIDGRPQPCRIDTYGPTQPLPAEIRGLELHPEQPPRTPSRDYFRYDLGHGIARHLVVLENTVVDPSPAPRDVVSPTYDCVGGEPWLLTFVDPDDLSITRTATAPTCLSDLVAEQGGRSFVAAYGRWPDIYLGRFDDQGRETLRRRLMPPMEAPGNIEYEPQSLALSPSGRVAVVLRDQTSGVGPNAVRSETLLVTNRELEPELSWLLGNRELLGLEFEDEDTLALTDHLSRSIRWFELASQSETGSARVSNVTRSANIVHAALVGPRRAVLSATGQFARFGRVTADEDNELFLRPWPWSEAEVTSSAAWPPNPNLRVVGLRPARYGGAETLSLSALALFSPSEGRYLPVASVVGEFGFAGPMRTSASGDVWVLYPWTGRLLRIRPIP